MGKIMINGIEYANSIIVNGTEYGGNITILNNNDEINVIITTEEESFYNKTVVLTDGKTIISNKFSNKGICIFNNIELEGDLTAFVIVEGIKYETTITVKKPTQYTKPLNKYKTYGLKIDLEDKNPETWGTWTGSSVTECSIGGGENEIDTFMGYYPVVLDKNGNEIIKINPLDYKKDINNNLLILDDYYNVMIAYPSRGYRIFKSDETHMNFEITNEPNKKGFKYFTYKGKEVEKLYIGAYENTYVLDSYNKYYWSSRSLNNIYPTVTSVQDKNWQDMQDFFSNYNNEYYSHFLFNDLTYLQICAMIKYKGKELRNVLGKGYFKSGNIAYSGNLNDKGLNYGDSGTSQSVKLFGCENLYGSALNIILGLGVKRYLSTDIGIIYTSDFESVPDTNLFKCNRAGVIKIGELYSAYPVGDTDSGFLPGNNVSDATYGLGNFTEIESVNNIRYDDTTEGYNAIYFLGGKSDWRNYNCNFYRFNDLTSAGTSSKGNPRITYHKVKQN